MVVKKVARRKPTKRVSKRAPAKRRRQPTKKQAITQAKMEATRVSLYLRAVENSPKGPGRRRNPEVMAKRIEAAQAQVKARTGLARLQAVQRLRNFQRQAGDPMVNDFERFEKNFIASAKSYGDRNGIDYGSWRACGVTAAVLKEAGIPQTRERVE